MDSVSHVQMDVFLTGCGNVYFLVVCVSERSFADISLPALCTDSNVFLLLDVLLGEHVLVVIQGAGNIIVRVKEI